MSSLALYESADPSSAFSVDSAFTNPLLITIDGTTGGVIKKKFYVRGEITTTIFSAITLVPVDSSSLSLIDGTIGYSWKLKAGNDQPLEAEWDTISAGNTIPIADIDNGSIYYPFWLRVEVPRGASIQSFDQVALVLTATETLIP